MKENFIKVIDYKNNDLIYGRYVTEYRDYEVLEDSFLIYKGKEIYINKNFTLSKAIITKDRIIMFLYDSIEIEVTKIIIYDKDLNKLYEKEFYIKVFFSIYLNENNDIVLKGNTYELVLDYETLDKKSFNYKKFLPDFVFIDN